jgi:hypothetical protein
MLRRAIVVLVGLAVSAYPVANGRAREAGPEVQPAADAARRAEADKAAVERTRAERARRRDAEARLRQLLENPPGDAPPSVKRLHEERRKAAARSGAQRGTP